MSALTVKPPSEPSGEQALAAPAADEQFYASFIARNGGLISEREQQLLRRAAILVAGCGSIGGAVVEPLVRLGAERLVLAEPDGYELHNLNRQHASLADVERNKAAVLADWAVGVNPYARVRVEDAGITPENVAALVSGSALVFDGVDVTSQSALVCKYLLHKEAKLAGVPVISGYDIAGVQLVMLYDYRRRGTRVLNGRIPERDVPTLEPMRFLSRVVPMSALPAEFFPVLSRPQTTPGTTFPQLVYTARMFGVVASRVALDLLAGRAVRKRILVDIHDLTRPRGARLRTELARIVALARFAPALLGYRK